jgi:hypothetical protein
MAQRVGRRRRRRDRRPGRTFPSTSQIEVVSRYSQEVLLVGEAADHSPPLRALLLAPHVQKLFGRGAIYREESELPSLSFSLSCGATWPSPSHLHHVTSAFSMWQATIGAQLHAPLEDWTTLFALAVRVFAEDFPSARHDELLLQLWRHYWILDLEVAANLLFAESEGLDGSQREVEGRAIRHLLAAQRELRQKQRSVDSAARWAHACFCALPRIRLAQLALASCRDRDQLAYRRLADELSVDTRMSFADVAASAIRPSRPAFFQHLAAAGDDQQKLRHLSHARFSLPHRWVEMAGPLPSDTYPQLLAMFVCLQHTIDTRPGLQSHILDLCTDQPLDEVARRSPHLKGVADLPGARSLARTSRHHEGPPQPKPRTLGNPVTAFKAAATALRANRSVGSRVQATSQQQLLFLAQVLNRRRLRRIATRWRERFPHAVTDGLAHSDRFAVTIWIVDPNARTTCRHNECALGAVVSAPLIGHIPDLAYAPPLVAQVVADSLAALARNPEPSPLVQGILLETLDAAYRPAYWHLDFTRNRAVVTPSRRIPFPPREGVPLVARELGYALAERVADLLGTASSA